MTHDMWKLFPQLIVEKINSLLEEAVPNRMKAYQIYKTCQNENLWNDTFTKFNLHLEDFFSTPANLRTKSTFDVCLDRPMHKSLYEMFQLDFRTAHIETSSLQRIANWAHHMMRLNTKATPCLIEQSVFEKTLHHITHPSPFEKAQDIDFDDFCFAWKRIVFQLFGKRYETEIARVLNELRLLEKEQQALEQEKLHRVLITLTQTEINWTESVLKAVYDEQPLPAYPLRRGPQKPSLQQIEKVVQLYNIVQVTTHAEIMNYKEKVRHTLVYRCEELLRSCHR